MDFEAEGLMRMMMVRGRGFVPNLVLRAFGMVGTLYDIPCEFDLRNYSPFRHPWMDLGEM